MPPTPDLDATVTRALSHLLPQILLRTRQPHTTAPLILGISGLQGSGKTTWAATLVSILTQRHALPAVAVSLDDFYKTHDALRAQRDADPGNKLFGTRGQPGTHDVELAAGWFRNVREWDGEGELRIPRFDKSRFGGEGDRAPEAEWPVLHRKPAVVVFEGWCVGFQARSAADMGEMYRAAKEGRLEMNTPAQHDLSHLLAVNEYLREYCDAFMGPQHFDFFVHIDTEDLGNVYAWRLQQEHRLIEERGEGMGDERVRAFIDGYMPSYEIYLGALREGLWGKGSGRMVRVRLDEGRGVVGMEEL